MRILFVLHTFPPESWGGTELHVRAIARVLARDHEVRIFCRAGDPERPQGQIWTEVQDGLEVVRFNNLYEDYLGFESTFRHRGAHEAFLEQVEDFRPELIHIHHLTGLSTTIVEAAKERALPVVFSLHDFWMVCPRGQRLHPEGGICEVLDRDRCQNCLHQLWPGWLEERLEGEGHEAQIDAWDAHSRTIFRLCDLILTPSRFHRQRMIEDGDISPGKIRALAHGLDHELFQTRDRPDDRVRTIGYIGAVIPTKGVEVLIEAFAALADPELNLEIWGEAPTWHEESGYLAELRAQAGPGVRFMGRYEHIRLPTILQQIDILVVPSLWWETFSLTIREAMLAGIPVVASDLGAMREALQDTEAGLLFPAGDPEALAGALERLIRSPELRRRYASHRDSVKTIERNAADYLNLYHEAIQIAEQRRDLIEVKPSSFPEKKPDQAVPGSTETPKDLKVSIEKIGGGDVRVSSAVERGSQTRVSFVFDYGPSDEAAEVRLTVDFGAGNAEHQVSTTAANAPRQPASIPAEAEDSTAKIVASMTPEAEAQAHEEALYKLDQGIFPAQVKKMDEMVGRTHLEDEEQVPRSRRRRRPEGEAGPDSGGLRTDDSRPAQPERGRGGDDRRPRREDRPARPRDDERPGRDRDPRGREERPPQGQRERADRPPRRDERPPRRDDRPARSAERPPRRDERPARSDERPPRRDERPARSEERTPRREGPPRDHKPAAREAPAKPAKPAAAPPSAKPHGDGEVVWDGAGGWQLPEGSPETPPTTAKPDRAPHHRVGRQPSVQPGKPTQGGFGEGL